MFKTKINNIVSRFETENGGWTDGKPCPARLSTFSTKRTKENQKNFFEMKRF